MKYDVNKPAPAWAILEARRRAMMQADSSPHLVDWCNCTPFLRHLSHLVALTEEAPVDPVVLKARALYCAAHGSSEKSITATSSGWDRGDRRIRIEKIVEMLNAEA